VNEETDDHFLSAEISPSDEISQRIIIAYITNCDKVILEQISPETAKYKRYIKLPLFFTVSLVACFCSFGVAVIKCGTELFKNHDELSLLTICCFSFGFVLAIFQTLFLNIAMKNFDQLEVMPMM
jgi:hypothetical protein